MALDPWSYAAKTRNEHAEQVALFMWANMAMRFGTYVAGHAEAYNVKGWAKKTFDDRQYLPFKIGTHNNVPLEQLKWLHAIHNQGHGDAIRGGKAKAEGVKAGVADIFLPVPRSHVSPVDNNAVWIDGSWPVYCGLYIELKKQDSGKPHAEQLEFQTDMRAAGYKAEIIQGWELARDEILSYLGFT